MTRAQRALCAEQQSNVEAQRRSAIEAERRSAREEETHCWKSVKGKHPGQPDYNRVDWGHWQDLANRVQALTAKLKVADNKGYRRR